MHKRPSFWKSFCSEQVNEYQKLLKSAAQFFYVIFSLFWAKLSYKISFLINSKILLLLVNDSQKLLKSAEKYIYATFLSFWTKLS